MFDVFRLIGLMSPEDSWVAKWQKTGLYSKFCLVHLVHVKIW